MARRGYEWNDPEAASMIDVPPVGVLGVSACSDKEPWKYFIAVSSTKNSREFEEYIVPASTWAIFPGSGINQSIQKLEQRIITEWLPTSGYEYADAPDIEVYLNSDPENSQYEVWIPVRKNNRNGGQYGGNVSLIYGHS